MNSLDFQYISGYSLYKMVASKTRLTGDQGNLIGRQELMAKTGVNSSQLSHLQRVGLIPPGLRRSRGRASGVQAFYPIATIKRVLEIRETLGKGITLTQQAITHRGQVDQLAPAILDRGWVVHDFKISPRLSDKSTDQLDAYLEVLLASGLVDVKVRELYSGSGDALEFTYREFAHAGMNQLAEWIARSIQRGLAQVVGEIALFHARITMVEQLHELESETHGHEDKQSKLLNQGRIERVRSALRLVEAELRKADAL